MRSELAQYPITFLIIAVTVFVSWRLMDRPQGKRELMLHPYSVFGRPDPKLLLTHAFVHRDWIHLIFNMYVLYMFGQVMEIQFLALASFKGWSLTTGRLLYLGLYFGSVLSATAPALYKHRENPYYFSLGASGGVSGIVLAFVLFYPFTELLLFFIIPMPALLAGVLFFAYEYAMSKRGGSGIAHDAHLGGAIFGLLFTIGLYPQAALDFWMQVKEVLGMGGG